VRGDIRDRELLKRLFTEYDIDTVVHFAVESRVDRRITDPEIFLTSNVLDTQVLLDTAKASWKLESDNKYLRDERENVRFWQVSTNEVYGAWGREGKFEENTPLAPDNHYSASKVSADMI